MKHISILFLIALFLQASMVKAQSLALGDEHTVIVCGDSTAWATGANFKGQLGDNQVSGSLKSLIPAQASGISGIIAVAAGSYHTLALKNDGTVWAYGDNDKGQLGDTANPFLNTIPVQVYDLTNMTAIDGGYDHSIALRNDGTVWAWGLNSFGQLGDGTDTNRITPVQVTGLTNVIAVSAGGWHSMALKNDGTVWTWGGNWNSQLGDSTSNNSFTPIQVPVLSSVKDISAGYNHSLVLKDDGTVWSWGYNNSGQLGNGSTTAEIPYPVQVTGLTNITDITTGNYHSMALEKYSKLWVWGDNFYDQLGDSTMGDTNKPALVKNITNINSIDAGYYRSAALLNDGTVMSWGYNNKGQFGDSTTTNSAVPVKMWLTCTAALPCTNPLAYFEHSDLANTIDFTAYPSNVNSSFMWDFGDGNTDTVQNPTHTYADTGFFSVCLITSNDCGTDTICESVYSSPCYLPGTDFYYYGSVLTLTFKNQTTDAISWMWDFGDGKTDTAHSPIHTYSDTGYYAVCLQATNLCGTDTFCNDSVYVTCYDPVADFILYWDSFLSVQLYDFSSFATSWSWDFGDGNSDTTQHPIHNYDTEGDYYVCLTVDNYCGTNTFCDTISVSAPPVSIYETSSIIAGGNNHSMVICSDSTVWTCGDNSYGQLGADSSSIDSSISTIFFQANGIYDIISTVGGWGHGLALQSDGTVWAWGSNLRGQVGDSSTSQRIYPVQVYGLDSVIAIDAGNDHSMALRSNGTVWAWGDNNYGQVGDSSLTDRNIPVQVYGLTDIVNIAAGGINSLALREDGTVWEWGGNASDIVLPFQISGLLNVIKIDAGGYHSMAVRVDGTVWTWGTNSKGQLGNGTTTSSSGIVQATGLSNIVNVAAGHYHSMALKDDGTVWVWGNNLYYQLADSGLTLSKTPIQVSSLANIYAIATGGDHCLALENDSTLWAWGEGTSGKLGVNNTNNRATPVKMQMACNLPEPVIPDTVDFTSDITVACVGETINFTHLASGAWVNIQWEFGDGGFSNSPTPVKSYDSAGVYDVKMTAYYVSGPDSITKTAYITVLSTPPTVSLGNDDTVNVSVLLDAGNAGASYSWSTGATSQTITVDSSGTYYVSVSTLCGTGNDTINITVQDTVDFTSDKTVVCVGETINFTHLASGLWANIAWKFGDGDYSNSPTPVKSYDSVGVYDVKMVAYYFGSADSITKTAYITVLSGPTVSLGNDTTVDGSIILDAGNAGASYDWSTGATSQTITVDLSGTYLIAVTNSCGTTKDTINITVNTLVVDSVWPGDADNNGVANIWDILPIGLAYNDSGPLRANATTDWIGQYADDWTLSFANGSNHKYADCDGNGSIDVADVNVISLNYGNTHSKANSNNGYNSSNPDLYFEILTQDIAPGTTVEVAIMAGRDTNAMTMYGFAFSVNFNASLIDSGSVNVNFDSSWMSRDTVAAIYLNKELYSENKIDMGFSRISQTDTSGFGQIAQLSFKIAENIGVTDSISLELSFENPTLIISDGTEQVFNTLTDTVVIIKDPIGISYLNVMHDKIRVYPNPAANDLNIDFGNLNLLEIELLNLLGQTVYFSEALSVEKARVEISGYPTGVYFLNLIFEEGVVTRKLNIIR